MAEYTEGYKGLARIFVEQGIDVTNWVVEDIDKERGGMSITLPSVDGDIYLTWGDLYQVDIIFVHTKKRYNETVQLAELHLILAKLEEMRKSNVGQLRDMLKRVFSEEQE